MSITHSGSADVAAVHRASINALMWGFLSPSDLLTGTEQRRRRAVPTCDPAEQQRRRQPTDCSSSSTPGGNILFTKKTPPPRAFGTVTARFDFSLFKEVRYCHQGLFLITGRHQRETRHSAESLEGAFWWKLASSLG